MTLDILFDSIAGNVFEIIATVLTLTVSYYVIPAIKNDLVPWLREKRIYDVIKKLVKAVEKMYESGAINKVDKKATVVKLLQDQGIKVDEEILMLIESAVKDLDIVTDTLVTELKKDI